MIRGVVQRGKKLARTFGTPTANLHVSPPESDGVYYATVVVRGLMYHGVASVGTNPTFNEKRRGVEVYIFDFSDEIYGEEIAVRLVQFLRPQETFTTEEELVTQIHNDVIQTRLCSALK